MGKQCNETATSRCSRPGASPRVGSTEKVQRQAAKQEMIRHRNREGEEQDHDGSFRKSGLFHKRLQLVWEAEGTFCSFIMTVFSPRDPLVCVVN